ncbi:MAG TPA: hypothetical protein VKA21_13230, partial [Candidatus Binatia bacterium]|nr:hypothetical protein [Candidatus Binatia bacterium]
MRARVLDLVQALRAREIEVSVAEAMDALAAVAAAGVEHDVLREALAAALVKDEADRPIYDAVFDRTFPLGGPVAGEAGRRRGPVRGAGAGVIASGAGRGLGEG